MAYGCTLQYLTQLGATDFQTPNLRQVSREVELDFSIGNNHCSHGCDIAFILCVSECVDTLQDRKVVRELFECERRLHVGR